MFQFSISQYRCFYKPRPVRIAPVTLLMGENSSGKSSFLAAVRLFFDLFSLTEQPDFNRDPFNLGAYDQIAHYRGGKFGRAKHFSFEASLRTRPNIRERGARLYDIDGAKFSNLTARATFKKRHAQPSLSNIRFESGPVYIELTFDNPEEFLELRTPHSNIKLSRQQILRQYHLLPSQTVDFRFVSFLMPRILTRKSAPLLEGANAKEDEADFLSTIVNQLGREFRRYEMHVFGPVRTRPQRTYDPLSEKPAPGGEHVPYLLARLKSERARGWTNMKRRLEQFGIASGLFDEIDIKKKGTSDSDPFQIYVKILNYTANMIDVGYGVSQILPLLTEVLLADSKKPAIYLMQQPEVHLHPRAQAEFGSLMQRIFAGSNSYCIAETHSDYIVDRVRNHISQGEIKKEDVSVIFLDRGDHDSSVYQIELDDNGNLVETPPNYRQFFKRETLRSLGVSDDVLDS